ncbi:unnamed protein product, partial [Didymodactylos carnosus]
TTKPACASVYNTTGLKLPINPNGSTILNYPFGIFIDANDVVYVSDMNNDRVLTWTQGASAGTAIIQSKQPQGVYVDSSGHVYVVSKDNSKYISKYPPGINQTATLIGPITNSTGSSSYAIFGDLAGNLYASDYDRGIVNRFNLTGGNYAGATIVAGIYGSMGTGPNQLGQADCIYVDSSNVVYISDTTNSRIQKWVPPYTAGVSITATGSLQHAEAIVVDPCNGNIYVADRYNNRLQVFPPGNLTGTTVIPNTTLSSPVGVALDSKANLYVTDTVNNCVFRFNRL